MKKTSSKIIISLILAVFLWTGAGFGIENKNITYAKTVEDDYRTAMAGCASLYPNDAQKRKACGDQITQAYLENTKKNTNTWYLAQKDLLERAQNINWPDTSPEGIIKKTLLFLPTFVIIPILGWTYRGVSALFDISIGYAVSSSSIIGVKDAITTIWSLIRNIFNITFIFILLWSAIQMIIGVAGTNTKKTVANVIIAALLINFSLFITRIIVDAGNFLAKSVYDIIISTSPSDSIGTILTNSLGMSGLFGLAETLTGYEFIIIGLRIAALLVAIGAFFYATFLLVVRNVVLIFLMAMSPLGFMGEVLPQVSEYSKMWWSNLLGQVFIPSLFLLFTYLIVLISNKIGIGINTENINAESVSYLGYFKYLTIIILLLTAVKITKKLSGEVGKFAEKIGKAAIVATTAAVTGGAVLALGAKAAGGGLAGLKSASKGLLLGDLGDKPGIVGMGARYARASLLSSVKDATGGKIDIAKFEKTIKKGQKDEEARRMKEMESVGPQKAIDTHEQFKKTRNAINQEIEEENPQLHKKVKSVTDELRALESDVKIAEKKMAIAQTDEEKEAARSEKETAEQLLTLHKKESEQLLNTYREAQDAIAKSKGTSMGEIEFGMKKAKEDIQTGRVAKEKYIEDFEKGSFIQTGMFPGNRKKVASNLRKGKKDISKQLKALLEEEKVIENTNEESPKKEGGGEKK